MPTRPSGRVSYEGLNSALAGGITPAPMGVVEGELWPRLTKVMEMLRVASKKRPFNEELNGVYQSLRSGLEEYRFQSGWLDHLAGKDVQGPHGSGFLPRDPTLEETLNPNFKLGSKVEGNHPGYNLGEWLMRPAEGGMLTASSSAGSYTTPLKMNAAGEQYMTLARLKAAVERAEDMMSRK